MARTVFAMLFRVTPVSVRVPGDPELSPIEIDLFVLERKSIAPSVNEPLAPVLVLRPLLELGEKLIPKMGRREAHAAEACNVISCTISS